MMENQGNAVTSPQDQQDMQLPYASNEHGHLVQQILDSQKELSQITGKTEIVCTYLFTNVYDSFTSCSKL